MTEFHQLRSRNDETSPEWIEWDAIAQLRAKEAPTAPLPSLDHLKLADFENVYEPAEDTFLLIDALSYEFQHKQITDEPAIVVELGVGSGVPLVFFSQEWEKHCSNSKLLSFATDVNLQALSTTRQTASTNNVCIPELIRCDLASALLPRLAGQVQVLLFNPPYVPTPDEEVGGTGIEASWAGGVDGRRVVDRAIDQIAQLLEQPNGVAYLITVDDNRPVELARLFLNKGLEMKPLFRRRARNEYLSVQKLTWIERDCL
jgi:release factor glutamine methyltransferase